MLCIHENSIVRENITPHENVRHKNERRQKFWRQTLSPPIRHDAETFWRRNVSAQNRRRQNGGIKTVQDTGSESRRLCI